MCHALLHDPKFHALLLRIDHELAAQMRADGYPCGRAAPRNNNGVTLEFQTLPRATGTRKNDDGTLSFVSIDPTLHFFPLVVNTEGGKPVLVARDGQHEYGFATTK